MGGYGYGLRQLADVAQAVHSLGLNHVITQTNNQPVKNKSTVLISFGFTCVFIIDKNLDPGVRFCPSVEDYGHHLCRFGRTG